MTIKNPNQITKSGLETIFREIDQVLDERGEEPLKIVVIGAASILMLDVKDRGTVDIDIAPVFDAEKFCKIANGVGVDVDLVSVTSTVDFQTNDRYEVFRGRKLIVYSVNEVDLIKLKLERFRKQDPADIDAIIQKFGIDYQRYRRIVLEAMKDYVGNERIFAMSILQAAQNNFKAEEVQQLERELA